MDKIPHAFKELTRAAEEVWKAYLEFGPVDDGSPQGKKLEKALDELSNAKVIAKYYIKINRPKRKR